MLRILCRNGFVLRSGICRLSDIASKITILPTPSKDSLTLDNLELPAPPYTKPFEQLYQESQTEKQSDVAEFVDSLGPLPPVSFNLAAYVNKSESLQNLVRLGVDLSRIEQKPEHAKYILTLDFEKHIKNHIHFLHDNGVIADDIGRIITKNPYFLKETLENITIKMNYLTSKRFTRDAIVRIIVSNPLFLSLDTIFVDSRLGFFQRQFSLSGNEVRQLVAKAPKLISVAFGTIREKLFLFKEEFGYSIEEIKKMMLMKPKILMLGTRGLREKFDIVHNLMGIPHERILLFPEIFLKRSFLLKQRHLYLVHLNRAQYDSKEPLYVSLYDIATTTDVEFCKKCSRTSVEHYNEFLKTL